MAAIQQDDEGATVQDRRQRMRIIIGVLSSQLRALAKDPDSAWREFAADWTPAINQIKKDIRILLAEDCCKDCGMPAEDCICTQTEIVKEVVRPGGVKLTIRIPKEETQDNGL
jgi:hypothetical protein